MEKYNKKFKEENKDVNELIGKLKSQYGTIIKKMKQDPEFKKLSKADKEYVIDELMSGMM